MSNTSEQYGAAADGSLAVAPQDTDAVAEHAGFASDKPPLPPWVGGYTMFAPTTPGFAGYAGSNRIVSPDAARDAYKPAKAVCYSQGNNSFNCECTLTDTQVLEFCRTGVIVLPGVVPDGINHQACEWLQGNIPSNPAYIPQGMSEQDMTRIRATHEPSTILLEQWFIDNVLLNPTLAGVMRSLLGPNVGLPVLVSHHGGISSPGPPQNWHQDADCIFAPELNFLEVFYFPQDTPESLGPTEVMPGTHHRKTTASEEEEGLLSAGPPGTLVIHHQSILHRRARQFPEADGVYRHMLK